MKEIYEALKKGNRGRGLSYNNFVKVRNVGNETIDALTRRGNIKDYAANSEVIKDKLNLPETAKAYQRMMEKYTNPELRDRFERIQNLRQLKSRKRLELNNELSSLRQNARRIRDNMMVDPMSLGVYGRKYGREFEEIPHINKDMIKDIGDYIKHYPRAVKGEIDTYKGVRVGERLRKKYNLE